MTSRRSSGSMRAESAVEPTKSENITVTWRRSAVSGVCSGNGRLRGLFLAACEFSYRSQQLTPMTK